MSEAVTVSPSIVLEQRQTVERPLSVELTLGAKGRYRWSIKCYASDPEEAVGMVSDTDAELRALYGPFGLEGGE